MNIFTSLPFLQGFPSNRPAANGTDSYARGYGNRIASAELFAPLGHGHGHGHGERDVEQKRAPRKPIVGKRSPAAFLNDPCPLGACG